jgi:hypothetical protein
MLFCCLITEIKNNFVTIDSKYSFPETTGLAGPNNYIHTRGKISVIESILLTVNFNLKGSVRENVIDKLKHVSFT